VKVTVFVLNEAGEPHFRTIEHLNADKLIEFAKKKEPLARERGANDMVQTVTAFGQLLVEAVNTGEHLDVSMAVMNLVMSTWLLDSLYFGVTADTYHKSAFEFIVAHDGAVIHKRVPATEGEAKR
jgi:hypothetical protein